MPELDMICPNCKQTSLLYDVKGVLGDNVDGRL
jgi:hypothetical protein